MALVTRSANASMDASTAMYAPQLTGLIAGEALDIAAPCYIKSSDGLVYMSNATSANEAAEVAGFTPRAVAISQPVTLFGAGTRFGYGTGLTPGNILYLGATAGRLDDGATTGDAFGYAQVVTATDIVVFRTAPRYTSATVGAGTIDATALASDAVTTAKILDAAVSQAKLEVGADSDGITGLVVQFAADANVVGAIPVVHRVLLASGVNADIDVLLTHKTRIIDFWVVMKGAGTAGCLVTLKNVTTAISDAMDVSAAGDRDIARAGEISDAQQEIAAGANMRISTASTGGDFPGAEAYVLGLRVA